MKKLAFLLTALVLGCASTPEDRARHAAAFRDDLQAETRAYFATNDAPSFGRLR